jgi:hypothetical protein
MIEATGSRVEYTPRELLSERDGVNIHRQSLASNKLSHLSQSYKKKDDGQSIREGYLFEGEKKGRNWNHSVVS